MDIDPYKQWLQIEDTSQPNHYELLGIPIFTEDPEAIQAAYARRYEAVHPYQSGKRASAAQKLIDEFSVALRCLTHEESKRQYDDELRDDLSARETMLNSTGQDDTLTGRIVHLEPVDEEHEDAADTLVDDGPETGEFSEARPPILNNFQPPTVGITPVVEPARSAPVGNRFAIPTHAGLAATGLIVVLIMFGVGAGWLAVTMIGQDGSVSDAMSTPPKVATSSGGRTLNDKNTASGDQTASGTPRIVEWEGELSKLLVAADGLDPPRLHLLITSAGRTFEATSTDAALIEQALGCVAAAEDERNACRLRLRGVRAGALQGFFNPSAATESLELESIEVISGSPDVAAALTEGERETLRSLRMVGSYARFTGKIKRLSKDGSGRLLVAVAGRDYCVELPAAWQAMCAEFALGEELALVTETTAEFTASNSPSAPPEVLLLKAETVGQPDFADITRDPAPYHDRLFRYRANVLSSLSAGELGTAVLTLRDVGNLYSVSASATMTIDQQDFLDRLNWRQPVLVELKVGGERRPPSFELVSITYLDAPSTRVVFAAASANEDVVLPLSMPVASVIEPPSAGAFFSDVPPTVDLPAFSESVLPLLTFQRVPPGKFSIELDSSLCDLQPDGKIVAKPVVNSSTRWVVALEKRLTIGIKETALAWLTLKDKELLFDWNAEGADASAGQLKNCLVMLSTGSERHLLALRTPILRSSNPLPLEAQDYRIPFPLGNLPEARTLRVDIVVSYAGRESTSTQGPTGARGEKLDFPLDGLGDGKTQIEVVLMPLRDGGLALRAAPQYRTSPTKTIKLSEREIASEQRRLQVSIVKATGSRKRARDRRARQTIDRKLDEMRATLQTLSTFGKSIAASLQSLTNIRYQVYAQAGSRKLILVDGGYSGSGNRPSSREFNGGAAYGFEVGTSDAPEAERQPRRRSPE